MRKKIGLYSLTLFTSFLALSATVMAERENIETLTDVDCNQIPQDVIDIIQELWYIILIAAPIILIVMSLVDLGKTITSGEDGEFKKFFSRLIRRIFGLVIIMLLPVLINFILGLINANFSSCVIN